MDVTVRKLEFDKPGLVFIIPSVCRRSHMSQPEQMSLLDLYWHAIMLNKHVKFYHSIHIIHSFISFIQWHLFIHSCPPEQ